jgi:hypothetical protein
LKLQNYYPNNPEEYRISRKANTPNGILTNQDDVIKLYAKSQTNTPTT